MAAVYDPRGSTKPGEGVAARLSATALWCADPLAGQIVEWRPPFGFTDVQLAGPYRRWEHTHRLRPVDGGTEIYDHIVYRLPYEPLAGLLAPVTVRPWLKAIFDYRARHTEARLR
jgi:ligand-binding SRPBCC domain-containing protein